MVASNPTQHCVATARIHDADRRDSPPPYFQV